MDKVTDLGSTPHRESSTVPTFVTIFRVILGNLQNSAPRKGNDMIGSRARAVAVAAATALSCTALGVMVAPSAQAAASGCQVWRWNGPPASAASTYIYNIGGALCGSLTNGSKVRVKVKCGSSSTYKYGPWVTTANKYSTYNCGYSTASLVDYQIG